MESDQLTAVGESIRNLAVVVFGFQLTAIGLFDGSSFFIIFAGFFVSVAGLIEFFT